MRIRLLIANAHVAGGTSRTVSSTATALAARGHDVESVSVLRRRRRPAFPPGRSVAVRDLVDEYAARRAPAPVTLAERAAALARRVASVAPSVAGHPFDPRPVPLLPGQYQPAARYYSVADRDFTAVYAR